VIETGVHETFTPAAGNGGDATITLSASSTVAAMRFNDAFATGQTISYVMRNTESAQLETGIGLYAGSNQITRSNPTMTWNGTTRDSTSPTKVTFTNGEVVDVFATPIATTVAPPSFVLAGGDGICSPSGDIVVDSGGGSRNLSADVLYVEPYLKEWANPVDAVVIRFTGSIGAAKLRVALDRVAPDGTRGDRVFETSDWTGIVSAGKAVKTLASTVEVPPGWYWISVIADGTVGVYRHGGRRAGGPLGGYETLGANMIQHASQTGFTSWTVVPSWTLSSLSFGNYIPDGCHEIALRGV